MEGTGWKKHQITDQCAYCQETVEQDMNVCQSCGAHVVWFESPTWKRLFGKPDEYVRNLTGDELKATTPLQLHVIQAYGEGGRFRNVTQQTEFMRLEKKVPDDFIKEVLLWATEKHVPWRSFVGGIKNEAWLARWSSEQMEAVDEEQRPNISREELSRMLG